jgi:hypothetical protein
MLEKAIRKIETEMDQNKKNSYVQIVGGFLLQHLNNNPEAAEKMLQEGKTLVKSLDEMKKAAEKKRVGNCAVLTDEEGFAVVLQYFGVDGKELVETPKDKNVVQFPAPAVKRSSVDFDVDLDDLL